MRGLLISSWRKLGISDMSAALVRFCILGRLIMGPRLWRGPGGPIISGLFRSWLALGAFLVLLLVTLIMSMLSGSTPGPAGIMVGSKKSSPSSSSSS